MSHHEIEDLLGAYALDAVDPDEARLVEAHLSECPRCRAEVAEHREVAALLTSGTADPLPDGVWDRIAEELGDTPPPVPMETALGAGADRSGAGRRRRSVPVLAGLAAAAVLVVIAVMGAVLVNQRDDLDALEAQLERAQQDPLLDLIEAPGTLVVALHSEDGVTEAQALVGHDGDSVLLAAGLPDLDHGTYQLWGLPDGRDAMVSLGVLGASPERAEFHVEGGISTLAITHEPSGGSTQPSAEPLVTGAIA